MHRPPGSTYCFVLTAPTMRAAAANSNSQFPIPNSQLKTPSSAEQSLHLFHYICPSDEKQPNPDKTHKPRSPRPPVPFSLFPVPFSLLPIYHIKQVIIL